ncbi:MAG: trimethylamine methyltransferase family protein [Chloroflexota bacterium]
MKTRTRRRRQKVSNGTPNTAVAMLEPIFNNVPFSNILSEEGIHKIHNASMRLLKEFGTLIIDFPEGLEVFRQNGATIVEGNKVKIDEDTLMHFVNQAPSTWTQLARNPAKNLPLGGRNTVYAPIYGPPFALDLDRGRRQSTFDDFKKFAKLAYMAPEMHIGGGVLVEPNDLPLETRHLDMLHALATLSDKSFMGSVVFPDNARDSVDIARIVVGEEAMKENPALSSTVNASSPMRWDDRMLSAITVYAETKQAVMFTPFIIAGAMSPSTMAATVAQLNAEALFGICYAQMVNAGAPCLYGSFLANIDMKSGAPCFGTAENNLAMFAGGQMARHYGLPYRSGGNFTASRIPDAQSGYESASTMWATVQSGANFILHSAGWLEGGLIAGYEKFVLDLEICAMIARYSKGIGLTDDDFAWDAYEETPSGQHFLGAGHTMRHYKTAFHQHQVFSMDNFEKWEEEGSATTYQRANKVWKQMLRDYERPPIDPAIREELDAFVAKRRVEIEAGKPRTPWQS